MRSTTSPTSRSSGTSEASTVHPVATTCDHMQVTTSSVSTIRDAFTTRRVIPFIGIYDLMSASIAARHFDALFVSGFGFAASHYGLPDIGFIAWSDMVAFVQRVRTILPHHHLLVDIDDGYCDVEVAAHVVSLLEKAGASGIVLEDQRRPRRCGHFNGKVLLEIDDYVEKLERVLHAREDLFVVARTDAADPDDVFRRAEAYADAGADAILVDGLPTLDLLRALRDRIGLPLAFNQIAGGKSPACSLSELQEAGARLIIYSTPCLFAAMDGVDRAMVDLQREDGRLPTASNGHTDVHACTSVLHENLARRDR